MDARVGSCLPWGGTFRVCSVRTEEPTPVEGENESINKKQITFYPVK